MLGEINFNIFPIHLKTSLPNINPTRQFIVKTPYITPSPVTSYQHLPDPANNIFILTWRYSLLTISYPSYRNRDSLGAHPTSQSPEYLRIRKALISKKQFEHVQESVKRGI